MSNIKAFRCNACFLSARTFGCRLLSSVRWVQRIRVASCCLLNRSNSRQGIAPLSCTVQRRCRRSGSCSYLTVLSIACNPGVAETIALAHFFFLTVDPIVTTLVTYWLHEGSLCPREAVLSRFLSARPRGCSPGNLHLAFARNLCRIKPAVLSKFIAIYGGIAFSQPIKNFDRFRNIRPTSPLAEASFRAYGRELFRHRYVD
jgi:hypothetical protein